MRYMHATLGAHVRAGRGAARS